MKELSVKTLKQRIVKAIKAGNYKTQPIIEHCKAEFNYMNFCHAIAELQIEGVVIYKSGEGYYLA